MVETHAAGDAPPHFHWDEWYGSVGGRSISIDEVNRILRNIFDHQYPRFEGKVASTARPFASPELAATAIKAKATELGADIVGVAEIEASDLYRGRVATERYAIVLGRRMRYRAFETVPSIASAVECVRIYEELGEICIALAQHLRDLGFSSQVEHPIGDANVLHVPLALKAGFGELGRHGSIIHPVHGPLFRIGSVLTSMPLALDAPIDAGIAAFCDRCKACRRYCPADAIPDERDPEAGKDHLGNDRYVVDTGRCFPYFAKHEYCSACLPACVYNHKTWAKDFETGEPVRKFPDVVMNPPPAPVDIDPAIGHEYPVRLRNSSIVPLNRLRGGLPRKS